MKVQFSKYHGAGNDFIMIDGRERDLDSMDQSVIRFLCDRHFGIGADGLIILTASEKHDFRMIYYNADGREGTMCGNGGRCITAFARSLGITGQRATFDGVDGTHRSEILPDGNIRLMLKDVEGIRFTGDGYLLHTGSPHFVVFVDRLQELDVDTEGRAIRHQARFGREGTNVNFVEPGPNEGEIRVRTFERGVEAETLSCGTGVTASAISAFCHFKTDIFSYRITTRGGDLKVSFETQDRIHFSPVWLTGPASRVFEGEVEIRS